MSSPEILPPDLARAYGLAPQELVNYRAQRYSGDSICTSMESFVEADRAIVERVYHFLMALFQKLSPPPERDEVGPLKEVLREFQFYQLVDEVRVLGLASYRARPQLDLAKTIHDLRGGALSSLVGLLDALIDLPDEAPVPVTLFPLVRDHLKIMRNSLSDLDYARRQFDLLPRAHSIRLMVEKWEQAAFGPTDHQVRIRVTCLQKEGTISECCVESAAIDRILYNLMNNAARHAAAGVVDLFAIPVPKGERPEVLRFIVHNGISSEDSAHLRQLGGGHANLQALFGCGVSSTGSGLGLAITAEFVANAFGLPSATEAVAGGYVGAQVDGTDFTTWFHWPLSAWRSDPSTELKVQKEETV